MSEREDKNNLAYWFPKIEATGLPVPKTKIIAMPEDAWRDLWEKFETSGEPTGIFDAFVNGPAREASDAIGYPLFLRSGHTSAKHEWKDTCFVPDAESLGAHMAQIAYFSECNSMMGELPWRTWVFREILPTSPVGVCPGYGDMPINREFRFFVQDGEVRCHHPYWPRHALEWGGASISDDAYAVLCAYNGGRGTATAEADVLAELTGIACRAGRAVGGAWSVDILWTKRGWFVTDMAVASDSWHWPDCPRSSRAA